MGHFVRTQLIFIKDLSKINSFAENFIVTFSFLPNFAPDLSNDLRFFIDQRSKFNTLKGKKKIMKKIMMTHAAIAVAATMNPQVNVGGSHGFSYDKQDEAKNTDWTVMPEIGYNLDDNFAVGMVIGFTSGKQTLGNVENKTSSFKVNPYLRYTFLKLDKVNVFVDGGLYYEFEKLADNDAAKYNNFGVNVRPGVAVNLNDKLSFVSHFGMLGWSTSKSKEDGAKAKNSIDINLHSAVSFGLYYNF